MLKNNRFLYLIITIAVIILGIFSRKMECIPTFFGDTSYAVMIFFGFRIIFIKNSLKKTAVIALVFCFCIEFLQLYRDEWILSIRNTTLGHYALGQGFLWSDLIYYSIGIIIAFILDSNVAKNN